MNQQLYRRFDEPVNRVNTECIKWDNRKNFGNADALPMWVADMDFRTAASWMRSPPAWHTAFSAIVRTASATAPPS